jgi:hypothetical protein
MGPEVMLGMQAVSAVSGAVGGMREGAAAAKQASYQAQVARNNQIIAQQNADYSSQVGETQAQAQDLKSRASLGSIEAAQSASGLSLASPSLSDVREGSAQIYRLDTANLIQNAALRTRGYLNQSNDYGAEAALDTQKASDARTGGLLKAGGSLLSGASSFAEKWDKYYSKPI